MIAYARDEMVGITELSKALGKYLDKVISNSLSKIAIIRRNEPEAVIIPIQEYEYMKKSTEILEDMQIAKIIEERVINREEPIKYLTLDELEENLRKRGKNV